MVPNADTVVAKIQVRISRTSSIPPSQTTRGVPCRLTPPCHPILGTGLDGMMTLLLIFVFSTTRNADTGVGPSSTSDRDAGRTGIGIGREMVGMEG